MQREERAVTAVLGDRGDLGRSGCWAFAGYRALSPCCVPDRPIARAVSGAPNPPRQRYSRHCRKVRTTTALLTDAARYRTPDLSGLDSGG